jgi:hypothetical protein
MTTAPIVEAKGQNGPQQSIADGGCKSGFQTV